MALSNTDKAFRASMSTMPGLLPYTTKYSLQAEEPKKVDVTHDHILSSLALQSRMVSGLGTAFA